MEMKQDHDDDVSVGSSLSSHSDSLNQSSKFDNGLIIRAVDDAVLLQQAAESLQAALNLIEAAGDKSRSWVDARDLLDNTAAALDDAGLALRGRQGDRSLGGSSRVSGNSGNSKQHSAEVSDPLEGEVRRLADEVVSRRRSILGNALVHDADGPWAKMEYGDAADGFSFVNEAMPHVEEKQDRTLIVWASQTGTAKRFASRLKKSLGGNKHCIATSMKKLPPPEIAKYKRIYCICSTFGCGRPPTEAEIFYSLLQLAATQYEDTTDDLGDEEQVKPLSGVTVQIAALGSSAFQNFCGFGRGLEKELKILGAAVDLTILDAKNGEIEQKAAFAAWKDKILGIEPNRRGASLEPLASNLKGSLAKVTRVTQEKMQEQRVNEKEMQQQHQLTAKASCCTIQ